MAAVVVERGSGEGDTMQWWGALSRRQVMVAGGGVDFGG
jgi:hypothetical protein